jgi:hypothetical protein
MEWLIALLIWAAMQAADGWEAIPPATVGTVILPMQIEQNVYAIECVTGCAELERLAPDYRSRRFGSLYEALTFYPTLIHGAQPPPLQSP